MSEVGWRPLRRIASAIGADIKLSDRTIELYGGGAISIRSADNPDSLRGEGLDLVVIDEAAFVKEDAWLESLRPALADRQGKAIFISTPKGRNWFWRLWQLGQSGNSDYQSWQFPTSSNPYIVKSEIEAARLTLPERVYQQEFLAQFVDDTGGVFRRVSEAVGATPQSQAQPGHNYIFGIDWGKHNDYSCFSVLDTTAKELVYLDRFNQIDYRVQIGRLTALYEKFKPVSIVAESNAMGEPIIEQLFIQNLPVQPFTTNNASKARIIEGLSLAFERGDIRIIADNVLVSELQAYEMERLPSGLMRYNAPSGMHDDTVMSLAMAWYGASQEVEVVSLANL